MSKKIVLQSRIDDRVFLTMSVIAVLSLFALAFKYQTREPFIDLKLNVKSGLLQTGSLITFESELQKGANYEWDFGDNSKIVSDKNKNTAQYIYSTPGQYTVVVRANDRSESYINITIRKAPELVNPSLQPRIEAPQTAFVGDSVRFKGFTPDASSWEWRFGETNQLDATTQDPVYIFKEANKYKVWLVVNGRIDYPAFHEIIIVDKPEAPKETPKAPAPSLQPKIVPVPTSPNTPSLNDQIGVNAPEKVVTITEAELSQMLLKVASSDKSVADFKEHVCDLNIPVTYNGDKMTFSEMCRKLEKIRSRRIKNMTSSFKQANGCITEMTVNHKKSLL